MLSLLSLMAARPPVSSDCWAEARARLATTRATKICEGRCERGGGTGGALHV